MSDILDWETMSQAERAACKAIASESLLGFICVFFQLIQGQKFLRNWHHRYFCEIAESIYRGESKRDIVNCPPGATKTEIWSIHWPAWCIAKCSEEGRSSRWLPLSYSADLVDENSSRVREIILSEPFQAMWPMQASSDTNKKSDWMFETNDGNRHRMFGTSVTGQVTGRRAGYMLSDFTGALIIDDPLPPREEGYGKSIDRSNKAMNRIVRSRLAHDDVPIVMIQQRICKGDTTDFLMSDKAPDDYQHYKVPALLDMEYVASLPEDIQVRLVEDTDFEGNRCSYWPDKEPTTSLVAIETADPYLMASQYQQSPDDAFLEGVIWREEIEKMVADGRAGRVPVEPGLPVYTFWDWGMNDMTAVWLVQFIGLEIRLIASYGNSGKNLEHYTNWLKEFADEHEVRYEHKAHYYPHDFAVRESDGKTRLQKAKRLGFDGVIVPRTPTKTASINAVRTLFPRLHIDIERNTEGLQEDRGGWPAIKRYRREYDPDNEVFKKNPLHDWTSNFADALQQLGLAWRDKSGKGNDNKRNNRKAAGGGGWLGN